MTEAGKEKAATGASKPKVDNLKDAFKTREPGWGPATSAFKAINFELFVKPNKFVMACGVVLFTGCVSYITYMNIREKNAKDTYVTMDLDGGLTSRPRTSRWH